MYLKYWIVKVEDLSIISDTKTVCEKVKYETCNNKQKLQLKKTDTDMLQHQDRQNSAIPFSFHIF